ncbi:NAD(P)/FAD-dependent oxidoreductase [Hyphomonas sediminis]|uniref:NAD(P)/FAD-dependent oxidoreductase n=1 Tax=Hyphomonas sediminis TaxID=2866160 RepID=UPI003F708550
MAPMQRSYDVIVIGAGAAGLMCAIEAGKRGRRVWLVDHARKIAEKIRIAGGGFCNFTNLHTSPKNFLSQNAHFCKSALSRYTQQDFIALVQSHGIAFHEKKLGQLFCDESAQEIIAMLLEECRRAGVVLQNDTGIERVEAIGNGYRVVTTRGTQDCDSLVIATGGLSIPKVGATKFGYDVARQFGLDVIETRPGLVPLTFQASLLERCQALSGLSVEATVSCGKVSFSEGLLFTHRGLSGPSILQISSYWREGQDILVNLAPSVDAFAFLKDRKKAQPKQEVQTALAEVVPKRLALSICEDAALSGRLADLPDGALRALARAVNEWRIRPAGTEGYRTAEVTLGGVDTNALSSKTMEAKTQPGLFFVGEVMDVTGHLGGFNFQWAWSSGYVAGQYV